jgi:hypothetical protein
VGPTRRSPYRATSIVPGQQACQAARSIGGRRFLDVEGVTPRLPLADCDLVECNCIYAHHEDRRESQEDRRQPASLATELYDRNGNTNRRQKKRGRRKTDWA